PHYLSLFLLTRYANHRHLHPFPTHALPISSNRGRTRSCTCQCHLPPRGPRANERRFASARRGPTVIRHWAQGRMPYHGWTATCRSEEHTSNSSHGSISYAVFCLKKKKNDIK